MDGLIPAYLYLFILTIWASLSLLLLAKYIILLSSSNIVNEILGLSNSNSLGVLWVKLYLFSNGLKLVIPSG